MSINVEVKVNHDIESWGTKLNKLNMCVFVCECALNLFWTMIFKRQHKYLIRKMHAEKLKNKVCTNCET